MWLIIIFGIALYFIYQTPASGGSSLAAPKSYTDKRPPHQKPPTPSKKLNEDQIFIEQVKLSAEQQNLFNKIENSNENFFITGKAGTGKSALNVGGQTLNSLFRLPTGLIQPENIHLNGKVAFLLKNIDIIVIDEVSMVRVDMMVAIDILLRKARRNEAPFGGVQIVMFGDVYQLPPVVADRGLRNE